MIRSHHRKGIAFIVAAAILFAAAGVLALTQSRPAPAQDLKAIKADYRRPAARPVENKALADLGRNLFFDTRISASGKTSCASCHFPELGYVVTDAHSINDSGKPTSRKSQPLIGLGHAGKTLVGWDGRSATLEAQAKSSIATGSMSMRETSIPVRVEVIEERVKSDSGYAAKFNTALPGRPIDVDAIATALAAFERTLEPAIAPFDRWVAGDETAISAAAKRGFALFNGKAACVACHNGWRFTDDQFHDIGTSTTDQGRGKVAKDETLNFAFKTPTLRSVALRAPYMHNASLATLDDVMRHYEKGGIDRPSRSPLLVPIQLSDAERHDLVAFMNTLTGNGEGSKLRR
ncbi:MAG TPA: cytochrome c peroxidase [Pseudolabrys sp.]|nr:cytochrome c peroxidase [Pseudolabrys sp.]